MAVRVREHQAFDEARSVRERVGEHGRRRVLEHDVAMFLPPAVQHHKPGRRVRLGAAVEEALRHRVRTLDGRLLTMGEVPLQFADREAMERGLELLVDDLLVGA